MLTSEDLTDVIIQRLCKAGYKVYLCGGAVRDSILGINASDYDITTNALPHEIKILFPDRKVNLVGSNFLVSLIDDIEVATFRTDQNFSNGRDNCITSSCKTIEEDLQRRDFTINAMAMCPYTGEITDPFNGKEDLRNKIIRFVGNAEKRIKEDYLRIIRAARFACLIEGSIEKNSFAAIQNNKCIVTKISPERIRLELMKVMKYRKPSIFFNILHEAGILEIILPELVKSYDHTGGKYHGETIDKHLLLTGDNLSPKRPILRLTGYLHDIGKPYVYDGENFIDHEKIGADLVENIFKRYKFSNDEIKMTTNLILYHMRSITDDISDKGVRRLIKSLTDNNVNWKHWLQLKISDKKSNLLKGEYTRQLIKKRVLRVYQSTKITSSGGFKITDLKINGNDIMNILNIRPGKEVGTILKNLLNEVIDNPELNKRETLIERIKEITI